MNMKTRNSSTRTTSQLRVHYWIGWILWPCWVRSCLITFRISAVLRSYHILPKHTIKSFELCTWCSHALYLECYEILNSRFALEHRYGKGHDLDYDACRIADSLSGILAGKNALQLEIREYHFRGEHHRSGDLESLRKWMRKEMFDRDVLRRLNTKHVQKWS